LVFFQKIAATNAAVIIARGPAPGYSIIFDPNVSSTPLTVNKYIRFTVKFCCKITKSKGEWLGQACSKTLSLL
jgi:hypothetical protein